MARSKLIKDLSQSAGQQSQLTTEADHRRATSTAYYSVFHTVGHLVAELVFLDPMAKRIGPRRVSHSAVVTVARTFRSAPAAGAPPEDWAAFETQCNRYGLPQGCRPPSDLGRFCSRLVELQEMREAADYDLIQTFTREDARSAASMAMECIELADQLAESPHEATLCFLVGVVLPPDRQRDTHRSR